VCGVWRLTRSFLVPCSTQQGLQGQVIAVIFYVAIDIVVVVIVIKIIVVIIIIITTIIIIIIIIVIIIIITAFAGCYSVSV
jgi:hypothetical protein